MIKQVYKIIIIMLGFSSALFSQTAGETGMSFLKLGFGARNIAMGDVGSLVSNDVTALYYNPANLADNLNEEVMVMHNQWIQDVKSEVVGAKFVLFNLPFALGLNTTSINDIEIRTKPGPADATFNANYFFGSLSTGFPITESINFGLSAKYLYEGIFTDEATGFGFDFGLNYKTNIEGLLFSAVVRNLGSMQKLKNEKTKLPADLRAGAAYTFSVPSYKLNITAAGEYQQYFISNIHHINFGAEILYNNLFALRAGYQTNYFAKGFTGGIGIEWGSLSFDYAFSPFSYDIGTGQTISLKFRF
jgi:hypothetical protein